jgi:hypothetical protein
MFLFNMILPCSVKLHLFQLSHRFFKLQDLSQKVITVALCRFGLHNMNNILIDVEIKVCAGNNFSIIVNSMHFVLVRQKDRPVQIFA